MNRKYGLLELLMAVFILVASSTSLTAAPGDLDPSFGSGGRVAGSENWFSVNGAMLQPDGRIVTVGEGDRLLVRYLANGSVDSSFGNSGHVSLPGVFGTAVALQGDGRIVVAGLQGSSWPQYNFAVARFLANGSLDTSFGAGGMVTIDFGNNDRAEDIAIQADGKIVVIGPTEVPNSRNADFAAARLNADGSLDTSFDGDGKKVTSLGDYSDFGPQGVAIQSDGRIVVAGERGIGPGHSPTDFAIVRYNADGSLDGSFDGDGIVLTSVENYGEIFRDVLIQPDGKIVGVGRTPNFATVIRYKPNGQLDTSFDGDGVKTVDIGPYDFFLSAALQPDGKLVVGGYNSEHVIARFNTDGALDSTFGGDGIVTTSFDNMGYPFGYGATTAVILQPDGKIIGAGNWGLDGEFSVTAMARYQGDATTANPPRFDFDGDGRADISVFRPTERVWYLDRSRDGFYATQFGSSSDRITPADFDGDRKTDIAVYRDGVWWWLSSANQTVGVRQFGIAGDIPLPADHSGDDRDELAVFRDGVWWWMDLSTGDARAVSFGLATDKPTPADYDGDGRVDEAVYRNGEWHINGSSVGYTVRFFGLPSDLPVVGDYDGDGRSDPAVYRAGEWHLLRSTAGYATFRFGQATDVPTPDDFDGDGKADAAVYRGGEWYVSKSTGGFLIQRFGLAADIPVPSAYLP